MIAGVCGVVETGGGCRRVAGEVDPGVDEAESPWRMCLKRQSVNLQFPLFQKNRQTPLGAFGGRGLEGPLEEGLAPSCRHLQLAPRRQPAGVLKKSQTFRCDMVGMRNVGESVSSWSLSIL